MLPSSPHIKKTMFSDEIVQEFGWRNYTIRTNITKYEHEAAHGHHPGHMSELILANQTLTVTKTEQEYPTWEQKVLNISFIIVNSTEALTTLFVGEEGSGQNVTCQFFAKNEFIAQMQSISQNYTYVCPELWGDYLEDGTYKPEVGSDDWEFKMWIQDTPSTEFTLDSINIELWSNHASQ